MTCIWTEFLGILPPWLRPEADRFEKAQLLELRMRVNMPAEFVFPEGSRFQGQLLKRDDLQYCVNTASRYSPWAASTVCSGYITAPGGHRIGLCGDTRLDADGALHMQTLSSLCIRIARDLPGIAEDVADISGSILILGAPGWGKTTLLRDLCRCISRHRTLCVADERGELFPEGIPRGRRMDVLSGCPKATAVAMLLRTMGPEYIAMDEITSPEDCRALVQAANCGVTLLATAHAASVADFHTRPVYRALILQGVFSNLLVLHKDRTYTAERILL